MQNQEPKKTLEQITPYVNALAEARGRAADLINACLKVKAEHHALTLSFRQEHPETPSKYSFDYPAVFGHHSLQPSMSFANVAQEHIDELEAEATRLLIEAQLTALHYSLGSIRLLLPEYAQRTPDDIDWKLSHFDEQWQDLVETIKRYDNPA